MNPTDAPIFWRMTFLKASETSCQLERAWGESSNRETHKNVVRLDKSKMSHSTSSQYNRWLPSSKNPHFQNEARCTTFFVKMSFICMRMKNYFHIKGWAPKLVLKQRPGGTQKRPIRLHVTMCTGTPRKLGEEHQSKRVFYKTKQGSLQKQSKCIFAC